MTDYESAPDYYKFPNKIQVADISENLTSNGGQAVQYVARATRLDGDNKGEPVEDLRKAIRFLQREINRLEAKARPKTEYTASFTVSRPLDGENDTLYNLLYFGTDGTAEGLQGVRIDDVKVGFDGTPEPEEKPAKGYGPGGYPLNYDGFNLFPTPEDEEEEGHGDR